MQVKAKIRRSFGNASGSYDSVALLQRKVGKSLLNNLEVDGLSGRIVDLGCGTGFMIDELLALNPAPSIEIIALDSALPMLQAARKKLVGSEQVRYVCADLAVLPLPTQSVDVVLSNLAFQWCGDLGQVFAEIRRVLRPGGKLLFTTFGPSTLIELKTAWQKVDEFQHVNRFPGNDEIHDALRKAGFAKIGMTAETRVPAYQSVWDLMVELKRLGARTVLSGSPKQLTGKAKMQRMVGNYQKSAGSALIPATFEVISVVVEG